MPDLSLNLEARSPGFEALFDGAARLEVLAQGFYFTEGPVWRPDRRCLLFTDIPESRIYQWSESAGLSVFREPSGMANGLALDHAGRVLCCEHATSRLTRLSDDGRLEVLAERFADGELNSPNDVIVARDGTIYFTDPAYGRQGFWGVPRPRSLPFCGVYALSPEAGELTLLRDDFLAPNGLCLSADERLLFVNDSERNHIRRIELGAGPASKSDVVWAEMDDIGEGSADGMKRDAAGRIYCCGPGGIHVFAPAGQCLGIIHLPEFAANLAFGGEDGRDLFLTASTRLCRIRMGFEPAGP